MSEQTKTQPEWPADGQKEITWTFDEHATLYHCDLAGGNNVTDTAVRKLALTFGRYAQHPRSIGFRYTEPGKRREWMMHFSWYEPARTSPYDGGYTFRADEGQGWLVIARGYHPLERVSIIEHYRDVTIAKGYEPISIEAFEAWLLEKKLELLVDFRQAAIDAGWRPGYPGCHGDPPDPPPLELRRWYPEFS
jgi:hypothetical protein